MYFYCTYSIKTKILSMLGTEYFLKIAKINFQREKPICPNRKTKFRKKQNTANPQKYSLPQKFRATWLVADSHVIICSDKTNLEWVITLGGGPVNVSSVLLASPFLVVRLCLVSRNRDFWRSDDCSFSCSV